MDKIDGVKPHLDVDPSDIKPKTEINFSSDEDDCVKAEIDKLPKAHSKQSFLVYKKYLPKYAKQQIQK